MPPIPSRYKSHKVLLLAVLLPVILLLASIAGVAGSTLAQGAQPGQMPELTPTPARFFFPLAHRQPLTPKDPKPATEFTKAANAALAAELPFGDTQAYTDVQRNLIAPLLAEVITTTNGVAWDPQKYAFIPLYASTPDTVNPSLWRQSQLVNYGGLFQVTDRIYQVRNNDLSNLTIIEGDTGLIIVDPLVSVETARAALDLYRANRPMQNVVAVIYTHSHVDHFGGVLGVTSQQAVDDGRCKSMRPTFFWRRPAPKTSTPVTQWGNAAVVQHLQLQRDLFRFMHDQTLNLANQGYTPREIAETIQLPAVQRQTWSSRGYYGSLSHNVKAIYDLYLGWFDGNPANLQPLAAGGVQHKICRVDGRGGQGVGGGKESL